MEKFHCPRRFKKPEVPQDTYRESDQCCTYCGSLHPDVFMSRIEQGDAVVGPTDKSYKAYIKNEGGEDFKQTYRDCSGAECNNGPDHCTHWVTRPMKEHKFYYQHLSEEQRTRFIQLYNEKKMRIGFPGYFYVLPFFTTPEIK